MKPNLLGFDALINASGKSGQWEQVPELIRVVLCRGVNVAELPCGKDVSMIEDTVSTRNRKCYEETLSQDYVAACMLSFDTSLGLKPC